jgi:hypothetical protein
VTKGLNNAPRHVPLEGSLKFGSNPINRFLLNSGMLPQMQKNADGGVTLYIQHKSPGKDKEANWLPAPRGPIYMLLRMYVPNETAPSILPPGEGTWQPPGIVAS